MNTINKAFEDGTIKLRTVLLFERFIKLMHITLTQDEELPIYIVEIFKTCVDAGKIPGAGKATSIDLQKLLNHLLK